MKKRTLSIILAIVMMIAAFSSFPISAAEYDSDEAAAAAGMVCRIGDAGTGTYYSDFQTAFDVLNNDNASGGTITLIDDVSITGKTAFKLKKDITIIGKKSITLSFENGGFTVDAGSADLYIKDLTIKRYISVYNPDVFMFCRYTSNMTFENVDFDIEMNSGVTVDNLTYLFRTAGNATTGTCNAVMTFKDCTIEGTVNVKGTSGKNFVLFGSHNSERQYQDIVFDNTVVDVKGDHVNAFGGFNYISNASKNSLDYATVTLKGNTSISVAGDAIARSGLFTLNIEDTASLNTTANMFASDVQYVNINVTSTATNAFGTYAANKVSMVDGASIRISKSDEATNGIRFTANIDETATRYGLIFSKYTSSFDASKFVVGDTYTLIESDGTGTSTADGVVTYNVAVYGVDSTATQLAARAYAEYALGNDCTLKIHSAFNTTDNVRSIKEVATLAMNDLVPESQKDAKYCYLVKTEGDVNYYSPYGTTLYAKICGYAQ